MIGFDYGYLWEYEEFDAVRLLQVMADFDAPWWVTGGWALDLWMERQTRPHKDVDIAILRGDQHKLYRALNQWELYYAAPDHRLLPLRPDQQLQPPIHGVWVRRAHDAPWLCEFLLEEHEGAHWMYRENPAVRMPLADIGITVSDNIPILVPEIVLVYKAHEQMEKDEADFRAALPHLSPRSRSWLLRALNETAPHHPWITHLRTEGRPYYASPGFEFPTRRGCAGGPVSGKTRSGNSLNTAVSRSYIKGSQRLRGRRSKLCRPYRSPPEETLILLYLLFLPTTQDGVP